MQIQLVVKDMKEEKELPNLSCHSCQKKFEKVKEKVEEEKVKYIFYSTAFLF
ncbi:733_t:CDS:1, partial [Cetraspora pellucida]